MSVRHELRAPVALRVLGVLIWAMVCVGCGADGLVAPYTANADPCPAVDDYLAPLLDLAHEEGIPHLQAVFSEDLTQEERSAVVALVIDLVGALEPGALSALAEEAENSEQTSSVEDALASLTRWMGSEGPGAPYDEVFHSLTLALDTPLCGGETLFVLLEGLIDDERLLPALFAAANHPDLDLAQLVTELESPDGEPSGGLRTLLESLMDTAVAPDFKVSSWTALFGLIVDVSQAPWSELVAAIEAFFVAGPRVDALQELVTCIETVDPELVLATLLYDLLTSPPDSSLPSLTPPSSDTPLMGPALSPSLDALVSTFKESSEARRSAATLLRALVAPTRVSGVLTDLGQLFERGVLGRVLDALVAVATRSCKR